MSCLRELHRLDGNTRCFRYGTFSRSFTLPDGADGDSLRASLEGGVLEITVAKKPEVQPKKIDVKSAPPGPSGSAPKS